MMPATGSAEVRPLIPPGKKPAPPAVKLAGWNLNSSTMMARTGIATFHQVTTMLTRLNNRIARKLTAVKTAIRPTVTHRPAPVILSVCALKRPGQNDDHDPGDDPVDDGAPAYQQRGGQRGEQPARADDRRFGSPGGADQAHLSLEADVCRSGLGNYSHVRTFFRVRFSGA